MNWVDSTFQNGTPRFKPYRTVVLGSQHSKNACLASSALVMDLTCRCGGRQKDRDAPGDRRREKGRRKYGPFPNQDRARTWDAKTDFDSESSCRVMLLSQPSCKQLPPPLHGGKPKFAERILSGQELVSAPEDRSPCLPPRVGHPIPEARKGFFPYIPSRRDVVSSQSLYRVLSALSETWSQTMASATAMSSIEPSYILIS